MVYLKLLVGFMCFAVVLVCFHFAFALLLKHSSTQGCSKQRWEKPISDTESKEVPCEAQPG